VTRRCDVLIVGGGPAGSSCARDLVRAGLDVVVLDRARFPREKPCAGWITPGVVSQLDLDLDDYARGRTLQEIRGFETGVIGGPRVTSRFDATISHAIRRSEFDRYLLDRARARLVQDTAVTRLERTRDRWVVNGTFEAPVLIGAGGHFCPVARHLNPPCPEAPLIAAQEIEVRVGGPWSGPRPVEGEIPELYFCRDLRGYGWVVRKGEYLNVGFGRQDRHGVRNASRVFLQALREAGRVPPGFPEAWPGHAYLLYATPRRRVHEEGVLLAGDAAGLAYPTSGEGILTAVESGRLAAETIISAGGHHSRDQFASYAQRLIDRYGTPGRSGPEAWHVPPALFAWAGRHLMARPWFARHVLVRQWFLHGQATCPAEVFARGPVAGHVGGPGGL
jgi:geranylgeranyl reductase family protein